MSARPERSRLSDAELDLILSRSLDGDLSPEEERELTQLLARDPAAARRREELAGVVERLKALPAPAAPLGLTARVNAFTADRATGLRAVWSRLGIFPPPAMVRGIAALFVIVLIGMNVLRIQSEKPKAAEEASPKDDGRVAIFFGEKKSAAPAAAPAPAPVAKSTAPKEQQEPARRRDAPAATGVEADAAPGGKGNTPAKREVSAEAAPAPPSARGAAVMEAPEAKAQRKEAAVAADALEARPEAAGNVGGVRSEPALQKMKVAQAPSAPSALAWSIRVTGSPGWLLKKAPEARPSAPASARCTVTLDRDGRVVAVWSATSTPLSSEVETFVKGLLFSRAEGSASTPASTVDLEIDAR